MVDLAASDVARYQRQVSTEEKRDSQLTAADELDCNGLAPVNVCRRNLDLDTRRVEPGSAQFNTNPVSHQGVIFTALARMRAPIAAADCWPIQTWIRPPSSMMPNRTGSSMKATARIAWSVS